MPGARGEGILKLAGGQERAVLFTNRALADAERLTGKSVLQLLAATQGMQLGMSDTAVLLQVGMEHARREARPSGKAITLADAYEVMDQVGFAPVARVVMEALAAVLSYAAEPAEAESPPK